MMKPSTSNQLTPEMQQWLTDNREMYEFYLLHAMFHDPLQRSALLGAPVEPLDFRSEEYGLVVWALVAATKVMAVIGKKVAAPPTQEFMRTYIESAAREEGSDDDVAADAMRLVQELQDPKYCDQHYCVGPYFEAWFGAQRSKRTARAFMMTEIPDVRGQVDQLRGALNAARLIDGVPDHRKFDLANPPDPPEAILKLGDNVICTPGNISNIQGPPKATKSAVVGAVLSAAVAEPWKPQADTFGFAAEPVSGRAVLHFDTEQSPSDHDSLVRRAYARVGRREAAPWLHSYCLTGMDAAPCWSFLEREIERALENHSGIMLVILDGIAEFCRDPNEPAESFDLIRRLHELAIDHECAVITVLHENPGSSAGKTRGHLGSQLERKAETSLRVVKNIESGISTMWVERGRSCFMAKKDGRQFRWCDDAKMHVTLRDSDEAAGTIEPNRQDQTRVKYEEELNEAFAGVERLEHKELAKEVERTTGLTWNTARLRPQKYLELGLVEKVDDKHYRRTAAPTPPPSDVQE